VHKKGFLFYFGAAFLIIGVLSINCFALTFPGRTTSDQKNNIADGHDQAASENKESAAKIVPAKKIKIAIILDDAGHYKGQYKLLWLLPEKVTLAVIPGTPLCQKVQKKAREKGLEVIGHIPMEPLNYKGTRAKLINTGMSGEQISYTLDKFLKELPEIKGINNHMGSRVSVHKETLEVLMKELKKRGLFMIDSKTHHRSIIAKIAREHNVPVLKNELFLDNKRDVKYVSKKLKRLLRMARKKGYAVGIGHVTRKTTLIALRAFMTEHKDSIDFVYVSELFNEK
jgi:uncharacterized protein